MALETGTVINSLNAANLASTDGLAQADDHMRLIKSTVKASFPKITGAVNATQTELNIKDGVTASRVEINLPQGVTATTAEINYIDGVTSNIQTQINGIITDLLADTSPQLGGQLDTNGNSIAFGKWTIEVDGSNILLLKYSGDIKMRMTSAGRLMSKMTSQLFQEFNYDTSVIRRHFIWQFSFGIRRVYLTYIFRISPRWR